MNGTSLSCRRAASVADTLLDMTWKGAVKSLRSLFVGGAVVLLSVFVTGPAGAHGDIVSSTPQADAQVKRAPRQVSLVLAEAPAAGSSLKVVDGCGDTVSGDPRRDGENFTVAIDGGRPGGWKVQLRSISSVDGHVISERFNFRVAGERDCSQKPDRPKETDDIDTSSRPPIENDDEDSGFPIVPFALGTIAVVGVAVALRGGSRKS